MGRIVPTWLQQWSSPWVLRWGLLGWDALWSSRSPELTFAVFEQWCPHLQMGDMISVTGVSRVGPGGAPGLQGALGSPFLLSWPQGYTARAGTCGS